MLASVAGDKNRKRTHSLTSVFSVRVFCSPGCIFSSGRKGQLEDWFGRVLLGHQALQPLLSNLVTQRPGQRGRISNELSTGLVNADSSAFVGIQGLKSYVND